MAESFIQLPADSTGKKVRSFQQIVGANTVEHQGFVLCDSSGNVLDTVAATPAGTERGLAVRQVGSVTTTSTQLPSALETDGSLKVSDVATGGQVLVDQSGANAVLTFSFISAVDVVWVRSVGGLSRCDPFGGTPTATLGIRCPDDEPVPITVRATTVSVYAPSGATVTVWGFRG